MAAEWSLITRRPVATCRYVTGVTNIVKSNRRAIDIYELECAGLIVGVAGMHRYDKALGSRRRSTISLYLLSTIYRISLYKKRGNAEWTRFGYLGVV
jgi:hypothetical protein